MQRMLVRVAALALCTSALSACSMMGGGEDKAMLSRSANNSPLAIATDLTSAIHQAQLLRTKGDLDGATRVISQLMLAAPDDARVVGEYGKLLVQQGRSDDAAQFLRRAVELEPSEWTYYSALGVAYDQLRDPGNARNAYEHALALKPGEPAILNNYAMSRMLAGDTTTARALMIQAKASGSTDPKIAANLALLDSRAPVQPVAAPAIAAASTPPHAAFATNASAPVASRAIAPVVAHAPVPVASNAVPAVPVHTVVPVAINVTPSAAPHAVAPVASNAVAPLVAHAAPTPIIHNGVSIVMQAVPVDPKAGRVTRTAHKWVKPVKVAKTAAPAPLHVAAAVPSKPAKTGKTAKPAAANQIPALRMTADAGKP